MERYYTTEEVAALVGQSPNRIYYQQRAGRLPQPQRAGCQKLYTLADVVVIRELFRSYRPWQRKKAKG